MFLATVKFIGLVVLFICTVCSERGKRETDTGFIPLEEFEAKYRTVTLPNVRFDRPTTATPMIKEVQNPCEPYIAPKRSFSVPGRRISEIKCYEYIWDLKVRDEILQRNIKCEEINAPETELSGENDLIKVYFVEGGRETMPGEFPHMGAIGWLGSHGSWVFKCGSSLISHKFVLTAAHCRSASPMDSTVVDIVPKIVRLGDKNIMDNFYYSMLQRDINITRIIVHPKYASPKKYYDIALMELAEEVILTRQVQPACLWTKHSLSELGKEGTVTGWGTVESGGRNYSPELLAATIDFIDNEKCNMYLGRYKNRLFKGVEDHQLCAGKLTGGVDACQGDSGGPLQVKIPIPVYSQGNMHYVVGITSFGISCGYIDTPGIYTRVSAFIDWIEPIVWPNNTAA